MFTANLGQANRQFGIYSEMKVPIIKKLNQKIIIIIIVMIKSIYINIEIIERELDKI